MTRDTEPTEPSGGSYLVDPTTGARTLVHRTEQPNPAPEAPPAPAAAAIEPAKTRSTRSKGD